MNFVEATLVGALFQVLIIYVVLRLAHQSLQPDASPMRLARRHAMWAALIALVAGPAFGTPPLYLLSSVSTQTGRLRSDWSALPEDLAATALPFVALGAVYLLAQFTGPIGGGSLRRAELTVRRLRDYLPPRLTLFAGGIVLLGGISIALLAGLPAIMQPEPPAGPPDVAFGSGMMGRPSGGYFATVAGVSYCLFVLGVVAALLVIVRRRRVPTLTYEEDSIVRRVFINRLLRSAALVGVIVTGNCVDFAASGPSAGDWNGLRLAVTALGFLTVIVILIARPPVAAEHVDREPPVTTGGPLVGAAAGGEAVMRSGRYLGYVAWSAGMVSLLLTLDGPMGGLVPLAVLSLSFIAFNGAQLFVDVALARNHSDARRPDRHQVRKLTRPSAVVALVAALAAAVALALLGVSVGALPGASSELPFWFLAYGLAVGSSLLVVVVSGTRPPLRDATGGMDAVLRAASVRRGLLMTWSALLAFTAFLLSENRSSLAQGGTVGSDPSGQDMLGALVVALFVAAVVVAVLPGRTARAAPVARSAGTPR